MVDKSEKASAVELRQVSFSYGDKLILDKVDMNIKSGHIVGIVGLSGSGKTTLIRLINGAIMREGHHDYTGEVFVEGKEIKAIKHLNRLIGTVYQDIDNQLIFTTVIDEIVFGMENYCLPKEVMVQRLMDVSRALGIEHLHYKNPNKLSGGEKQLVVLASILCLEVNIIILDEALSGVDQTTRATVIRMIRALQEQGVTVIMIEHDYNNLKLANVIYQVADKKLLAT